MLLSPELTGLGLPGCVYDNAREELPVLEHGMDRKARRGRVLVEDVEKLNFLSIEPEEHLAPCWAPSSLSIPISPPPSCLLHHFRGGARLSTTGAIKIGENLLRQVLLVPLLCVFGVLFASFSRGRFLAKGREGHGECVWQKMSFPCDAKDVLWNATCVKPVAAGSTCLAILIELDMLLTLSQEKERGNRNQQRFSMEFFGLVK